MSVYYQDELAKTCACGCGTPVARRFVSGHNRRGAITAPQHRARIAASQVVAWTEKRERKPLGSTRLDSNGYRLVKVRHGGVRWDKEHVLVVEAAIGRRLLPGEEVHHINGVKTDNRIENLQLCSSRSEHQHTEASFRRLLAGLIANGAVIYDRAEKRYRLG